MYRSQTLALKYFVAAITFFGVMSVTGLFSSYYYMNPDFLFGILPFNMIKILHINTFGDLAADGVHGVDLLVSAGRIGS